MTSVDIDVALYQGETVEQALAALETGYPVSTELVTQSGPSGHPVVRVTGETADVASFLFLHDYPLEAYGL